MFNEERQCKQHLVVKRPSHVLFSARLENLKIVNSHETTRRG